jgi:tripartite-type tricarboxylate transporter receptor subunit TctC
MSSIRMVRTLVVAAAVAGTAGQAVAQEPFPVRPVTIVVPLPPGGVVDIATRPLAASLEKFLKQPVLVANRPGAAGAVGTASVANAKPDGYTILAHVASVTLVPDADRLFERKPAYTLDQLMPLALVTADPIQLAVRADSPHRTVKDLIAAAQAKPGQMVYSSSGIYGAVHVPIEMFLHAAGLKMRHLPTPGGGPAITALLGGHVDMTMGGPASLHAHVQAGKLRVLAGAGAKRFEGLPDVPTFRELGLDVEYYLWVGLFAPAGMPEAVQKVWRDAIRSAVADPAFRDAMAKVNTQISYLDTPEFRKWFEKESKRLTVIMNRIGKVEEEKK